MALDKYSLPPHIISQGDASRVRRELHQLDEFIKQTKLRQAGTPIQRLPKTSKGLNDFALINKFNLLTEKDRTVAIGFLDELVDKAPVVHISFAVDPSASFMIKITKWFRENIDHLVLVNVGLEPTIAAGCTVRTDNHYLDFSLRKHFDEQRSLLMSKLRGTPEAQA